MKTYFILLVFIILFNGLKAQTKTDIYVKGVSRPVISLNGTWKICLNPSGTDPDNNKTGGEWKDIQVPGECMMQGYLIKHDRPFVYKKDFLVPLDYKGKKIILRFEGVYSYARVWINGKYLRDHSGGFTAWECDITSNVIPGKTAAVTVEVTDMADEISYASGYAKHQIGGILRDVSLLALPPHHLERLFITTDLDEKYANAVLSVQGSISKVVKGCHVELELFDKGNKKVSLNNISVALIDTHFTIKNLIINPLKWDAEHPELYRLRVKLVENGEEVMYKDYNIGFREIEIKQNRFLVNGKQVKLRGACRHDIHPLLGRVSTPEYEIKDVLLAKEANINFIRTSHYPPTDHFLQLCDKYGIFVEDETAVCFVGSHRTADYYPGNSENSPEFTERYLSQLKEIIYNQRNHPSVIFWSIGNENMFGTNFRKSYDWVKSTDQTRPVIFSYPGNVPDSIKSYDLISMHYPGIDGNLKQYGKSIKGFGNDKMPVIFDEWAHVACYNNFTVKEDPNIRDFWGMSLDSMWQGVFDAKGGLGGAIWGMIDETFMLPDTLSGLNQWWGKIDKNVSPAEYSGNTVGYGEWGIVDTWRRKKPEFWNVKKAYSPVRILKTIFNDYKQGEAIEIPIYNRFDFTNINELTVHYTYKGKTQKLIAPDIPAHARGTLIVPIKNWSGKETVSIDFYDSHNLLLDNYLLRCGNEESNKKDFTQSGIISLVEDNYQYLISCENNLKIHLDKRTGFFNILDIQSDTFHFSGPFLNLRTRGKETKFSSNQINDYCKEWKLKSLSVQKMENTVEILIKGDYQNLIGVDFTVVISPDCSISATYIINNPPQEFIRELGIKFSFDNIFDTLSWEKDSYWSSYPSGHISSPEGKVPLFTRHLNTYRKTPEKEWQYDNSSFYYNGTQNETPDQLTFIARATKENVRKYNLHIKGSGNIVVNGNAREGCRIDKNGNNINLYINNLLDYPDLYWGNYQRNIKPGEKYTGTTHIQICNPAE